VAGRQEEEAAGGFRAATGYRRWKGALPEDISVFQAHRGKAIDDPRRYWWRNLGGKSIQKERGGITLSRARDGFLGEGI